MGNSPSHLSTCLDFNEKNSSYWWITTNSFIANFLGDFVSDLQSFEYEKSLGKSRLLKTIKGRHSEGILAIKVFVKPDQGISLEKHAEYLAHERKLVASIPNVCHYAEIIDKVQATYLVRQYFYSNLYDRISTRSFLQPLEKKWIAFQLLSALKETHERAVFHGDLKAENVLVTSWNWVYIVDFASFKPTYLPDDNPEDFGIFFDSSGRRVCCIAPERFYNQTSKHILESISLGKCFLDAKMDIFSLGCVIAELYLEGRPLFTYSKLLSYRRNEYNPRTLVNEISDDGIRQMVSSMIQLDPQKRLAAKDYLRKAKGTCFPASFYTFLHPLTSRLQAESQTHLSSWNYVLKYRQTKVKCSSDEFIAKLMREWPSFVSNSYINSDTALFLAQFILSHARGLCFPQFVASSLYMLRELLQHLPTAVVEDRLVPFLCYSLHSENSRVRKLCLDLLANCFQYMHTDDFDNALLFIIPFLVPLTADSHAFVRTALVHCLVSMCESISTFQLGTEAANESVHEMLSILVADDELHVKIAWVSNVGTLASFFGPNVTSELFLSHMITLLNNPCWRVRAALAISVKSLAPVLGLDDARCYLMPLLKQTMYDSCALVCREAIESLEWLARQSYFIESDINALFRQVLPFSIHCDAFVRNAAIKFCVFVAESVGALAFRAALYPSLETFLKFELGYIDQQSLGEALIEPLTPFKFSRLAHLVAAYGDEHTVETSDLFRTMLGEMALVNSLHVDELCRALLKFFRLHSATNTAHSSCTFGEMTKQNRLVEKWSVALKNYKVTPQTDFLESPSASSLHSAKEGSDMRFVGDLGAQAWLRKMQIKLFPPNLLHGQDALRGVFVAGQPNPSQAQQLLLGYLEKASSSSDLRAGASIPSGLLASQFSEHTGEITCSAVSPCGTYFVTGSTDGMLKIWDSARLEHSVTGHSCATYSHERSGAVRSSISCVGFVEGSSCIASAAQNGSLHLWIIPISHLKRPSFPKYARPFLLRTHQLDENDYIVSLHGYTHPSTREIVVCYVTFKCRIVVYLANSQKLKWSIQHPVFFGSVTSSLLSPCRSFLVLGSHLGVLSVVDLRFRLLVSRFVHPSRSRIRQLAAFPEVQLATGRFVMVATDVSALDGAFAEMSVWDLGQNKCVYYWGFADSNRVETSIFAGTESRLSRETIPGALLPLSVREDSQLDDEEGSLRAARLWQKSNLRTPAAHVHSFVLLPSSDGTDPSILFALNKRELYLWSVRDPKLEQQTSFPVKQLSRPEDFESVPSTFIALLGASSSASFDFGEAQSYSKYKLYQVLTHFPTDLLTQGRASSCPLFNDILSGPLLYLSKPFPCIVVCSFNGEIRVWK